MIYFYINTPLSNNWQQLCQQLTPHYQSLCQDYQKAIELNVSLRQKIEKIQTENQQLRVAKRQRLAQIDARDSSFDLDPLPHKDPEITIKLPKISSNRIKKQSSTEIDSKPDGPNYECTYEGCSRVYSSSVSMNLHIKLKHNGGTKKERQAYATILIEAAQRGEQPPNMSINLPPNFLQQFRTSYEYMKKYSM